MNKIVILGGTGLIGRHLTKSLLGQGREVVVLSRGNPDGMASLFPQSPRLKLMAYPTQGQVPEGLRDADAIINLAGCGLADHRWSDDYKRQILESRIWATKQALNLIQALPTKPKVFLNSSAIGYYGNSETETMVESSRAGLGFLSDVCVQWEGEARLAENFGVRVVLLRTGVVLAEDGGVIPRMSPAFKLGAGGVIGSGNQWMSWIHIRDQIRLIEFLMDNPSAHGPVNLTAPNPVTNAEFTKALGKILKRPTFMRVPALAVKLVLGDLSEILLEGSRVVPEAAFKLGFQFEYSRLEEALQSLVGHSRVKLSPADITQP